MTGQIDMATRAVRTRPETSTIGAARAKLKYYNNDSGNFQVRPKGAGEGLGQQSDPASSGPQSTKADVDHLIVGHRARQMADGLGKCIHVYNGRFADDRVIERYIAFNRPRDELCCVGGKL